MNATATVSEDRLIATLVAGLVRSPRQLNTCGESDAELIRLPDSELVLAVTTDCIVEEVETGLYTDPELLGWMTVAVNLSDLAAVGAAPLGVLLDLTLAPDAPGDVLARYRAGVDAACRAAGTAVLGGDTNLSAHPRYGGTAVGLIQGGPIVTRRGARPGAALFATGPLGAGAAFALRRLKLGQDGGFRPAPRLCEGALVRGFASCAMDTSDGLLASLDQLARLNGVGFTLDLDAARLLAPDALALAVAHGIAPWMLLAGPHGEFELVFTVPAGNVEPLRIAAARQGWHPVRLGRVDAIAGVRWRESGACRAIDTAALRALGTAAAADVDRYLAALERMVS